MTVPDFDTIYYDGHCGLCHRWVRRVLAAGDAGGRFRFSPLQGEHIRTVLSDEQRAALPDSIVVRTSDGRLLLRSDAILYVMQRLGGGEAKRAKLLRLVPRPLRELGYRFVAAIRGWLFRRPGDVCPMMPPEHRARFLR